MQNTSSTNATALVQNNIIFGPILSRRFGMSLGVDLSPSKKQCNFDCLYCELAPKAAIEAQEAVLQVSEIIEALRPHLHDNIDVITLTANGEPTLYPYLDQLVDALNKIKNSTQTLILTNSATLNDPAIFGTLLKIDQVKLSLDAATSAVFQKIDRPYKTIHIEDIIKSVIEFSKVYNGKLFIEILFVDGINNSKEEIEALNKVLMQLRNVFRIDIGTIDRPPAYPVQGITYQELHEIAHLFDPSLPIHIASRTNVQPHPAHYSEEEIINTLDKRPLTLSDIQMLFDDDSQQSFRQLLNDGMIVPKQLGNLEFYIPHANIERKRKKS